MHLDPIIPALCAVATVVLVLAVALRRLRQPHVVAFILAGVVLGPHGLGIVAEPDVMSRLGSVGVVLLLFFVGMEAHVPSLVARLRVAVIGTICQVLVSVWVIWILGAWFDWPLNRVVLLGFVISLSSTAVVLKVLQESGETNTPVGHGVTGILLVQDLAIVPMLLVLGFLGADRPSVSGVMLQVAGGTAVVALVIWILRRGELPVSLARLVGEDDELRLLAALLLCFGMALFTGLIGLSSALGAFLAGIVISGTRETAWIEGSLAPFHVLLVGAFFVSIGMIIDLGFLVQQWRIMALLVVTLLVTNTGINAVLLRLLGESWRSSVYAGALLAQGGELSFLLAAVGLQAGIIGAFGYQATVGTIAISLTLAPAWIALFRRLTRDPAPATTA